jgi:hypothetical protein
MTTEDLRARARWHQEYRREWDSDPDAYIRAGLLAFGKTRRLCVVELGQIKAYVGVQHVDTADRSWGIEGDPFARFFASMFVDGKCVALRTFPTVDDALTAIATFGNVADS